MLSIGLCYAICEYTCLQICNLHLLDKFPFSKINIAIAWVTHDGSMQKFCNSIMIKDCFLETPQANWTVMWPDTQFWSIDHMVQTKK